MGADRKRSSRRRVQTPRELGASPSAWKLEDAKARFSEVVRRARSDGPQRVSVRGKDAVVVVSAEEFERLLPPDPGYKPLVAFLEGLHRSEEHTSELQSLMRISYAVFCL